MLHAYTKYSVSRISCCTNYYIVCVMWNNAWCHWWCFTRIPNRESHNGEFHYYLTNARTYTIFVTRFRCVRTTSIMLTYSR